MTLPIREAAIDESELIFQVMIKSFQEYDGKLNPPSGALLETVERTIHTFHVGGGAALAHEGDRLVGSARYEPASDYMYIGRVSVLPEFRGRGVCKALLHFVENKARAQGFKETRVGVRLSIPENIRLYERLEYEAIEHKFYPDQTDSWYVMRKKL
ncbi:GNAT family N-acetyltransferase [Paenibacillus qinlingensis]|uniref:GNAT family N-acetyltransferase n=1 Tax=Paenibacillus qinlingensis TaxID=1837343 RepID=UPI001564DF11|nr:GNAT family N-acetyltransferase [Paenibacillus qinlingensis]NQX61417.1 GNAT family N-acetyltransferase [Paenibacillus qinlingensis]